MIHGANARGSVRMRGDVSRLIVMLRHRAARHADPVAGDDGQKQRAVVPMVIVLRNGRVNRIPRARGNRVKQAFP